MKNSKNYIYTQITNEDANTITEVITNIINKYPNKDACQLANSIRSIVNKTFAKIAADEVLDELTAITVANNEEE